MQPVFNSSFSYQQTNTSKPKITWIAGLINAALAIVIAILFMANETTETCSAGLACALAIPVAGFLFFDAVFLIALSLMAKRLDTRAALFLFWYSYSKVIALGAYEIYFLGLSMGFSPTRNLTSEYISVFQLVILPLIFSFVYYAGLQQLKKYRGEATSFKPLLIGIPLLLLTLGLSFRSGLSYGITGRAQSNTFQTLDPTSWTSTGAGSVLENVKLHKLTNADITYDGGEANALNNKLCKDFQAVDRTGNKILPNVLEKDEVMDVYVSKNNCVYRVALDGAPILSATDYDKMLEATFYAQNSSSYTPTQSDYDSNCIKEIKEDYSAKAVINVDRVANGKLFTASNPDYPYFLCPGVEARDKKGNSIDLSQIRNGDTVTLYTDADLRYVARIVRGDNR